MYLFYFLFSITNNISYKCYEFIIIELIERWKLLKFKINKGILLFYILHFKHKQFQHCLGQNIFNTHRFVWKNKGRIFTTCNTCVYKQSSQFHCIRELLWLFFVGWITGQYMISNFFQPNLITIRYGIICRVTRINPGGPIITPHLANDVTEKRNNMHGQKIKNH